MLNGRKLFTAIALLLATQVAYALEPGEPDPLFRDDSVIEIAIVAPMKTLLGELHGRQWTRPRLRRGCVNAG